MWVHDVSQEIGGALQNRNDTGTWVAQLVTRLILGFGSGHDLTVCEFEPHTGLRADSSEPGACFRFCVSLALCPSPARTQSLSLKNESALNKTKQNQRDDRQCEQ